MKQFLIAILCFFMLTSISSSRMTMMIAGGGAPAAGATGTNFLTDETAVGIWLMDNAAEAAETDDSTNSEDLSDNNTVGSTSSNGPSGWTGKGRTFTLTNNEWLSRSDNAALSLTTAVTMYARFKVTAIADGTDATIIGKYGLSGRRAYYMAIDATDTNEFEIEFSVSKDGNYDADGDSGGSTTTNFAINTWYAVFAYVDFDGDDKLYIRVNKVEEASTLYSGGSMHDGLADFTIGNWHDENAPLDGVIWEAALFNRALSTAECDGIVDYGISGNKGGSDS